VEGGELIGKEEAELEEVERDSGQRDRDEGGHDICNSGREDRPLGGRCVDVNTIAFSRSGARAAAGTWRLSCGGSEVWRCAGR
jgi:hypothetical protein